MKNFRIWAVIGILALALFLRLPQLGSVPSGLNRDEAALGYNAYSILKTGRDEYGIRFPVSITSFGDQKLPGYVYTLIPFLAVFGLSAVTIKLPSLLAGLAVIALVGRLAWLLFEPKNKFQQLSALPFLAMFLVAVSPWGNHFSRVAYEAHLAMMFFLFGLVAWLETVRRQDRQRWWLAASAAGFSLALLTYHAYHAVVPLTLLGLAVIYRREIFKLDRAGLGGGLLLGGAAIALMFFGGVWSANQTKLAGINPFAREVIERQFVAYRATLPGNTVWEKLLANYSTEKIAIFSRHLVESLSSDFLFATAADNHAHNQSGIGNLHLFIAPFIFIGLAALWNRKREKSSRLLWIWLLAGIVAPALTIAPQHTVRISSIFPLLEIIGAVGILAIWSDLPAGIGRKIFAGTLSTVIAFSILRYRINYLVLAPQRDQDFSEQKWTLLAAALHKYQPQAARLVTQSPSSSPYIFYLLSSPTDPAKLDIERYPADKEGFIHVRRIGNVYFETIEWSTLLAAAKQSKTIVFLQPKEVPGDKRTDSQFKPLEIIADRYGNPVWEIFAVEPL
jgi:4-amino-4-deoxy-L-arabinose transferase-like glycosyltransferase